MSEFRKLQAKLQKIEEGFYSKLAAEVGELVRANPKLSSVELVQLTRKVHGQEAATWLSDRLEAEGDDAADYFAEDENDTSETPLGIDKFQPGVKVAYTDIAKKASLNDPGHEGTGEVIGTILNDYKEIILVVKWENDPNYRQIHPVHLELASDKDFWDWTSKYGLDEDEGGSDEYWAGVAKQDVKIAEFTINEFGGLGFKRHPNWPAGTVLVANGDLRKQVRAKFKAEGWTKEYPEDKRDPWWKSPQGPFTSAVDYERGRTMVTSMLPYGSKIEEDHHPEDPINQQIKSLLAQGKKVMSRVPGAIGEVIEIDDRGLSTIQHPSETRRGRSVANFNSFTNLEIIGQAFNYDIVQHWDGDEIDEGVGDWLKRLDKKAAGWIGQKAARYAAKKVATMAAGEGIQDIGFDLSYGKDSKNIVIALEKYLEYEPEGEYAETIRYILPAQAKERGSWDDIMRQAEKHLGIPVNEGLFSWAADRLMNQVVKEINKIGPEGVAIYLTKKHGDQVETFCDSLKVYLQAREPMQIGAEKYAKLIKLRSMLDCKDRVHEAVVEVPAELRGDTKMTGTATSDDAAKFMGDLGIDDEVSDDVVDPETGELLFQPGDTKREEMKAGAHAKLSYDDFTRGRKLAQPIMHTGFDGDFEDKQEAAWELLDELRNSDFYNVVWRNAADLVDDPEDMMSKDYDVYVEVPTALKRKDAQRLDSNDHDNIKEILKAVKNASTMGNIGIMYMGSTGNGTTARFTPTFF